MKKYRIALALACLSGLGLSFLSGCMDENLASFANLTLRCTGNDLEQYVAGEWVLKTKCEAPAKCDKLSIGSYGCIAGEDTEIPELPACDPHDGTYQDGRKCNANRTGGFTCSQDRTLEMFTCKTGEHCNLSTFECLSDAEAFEALANETCEAGSKLCHENASSSVVTMDTGISRMPSSAQTTKSASTVTSSAAVSASTTPSAARTIRPSAASITSGRKTSITAETTIFAPKPPKIA